MGAQSGGGGNLLRVGWGGAVRPLLKLREQWKGKKCDGKGQSFGREAD